MRGARSEFREASGGTTPQSLSKEISRDCPRVVVRFSEADFARLQELADGAALATYIRATVLGQRLRKRPARGPVHDRHALAQCLALLGQSRIANNLNQLAYRANIGALTLSPDILGQIEESYDHVREMRALLIAALGKRP